MASKTLEERAEDFIRDIVLNESDPSLSMSEKVALAEATGIDGWVRYDIVPFMEKVIEILRRRDFKFASKPGTDLEATLINRCNSPARYGYKEDDVRGLDTIFPRQLQPVQ